MNAKLVFVKKSIPAEAGIYYIYLARFLLSQEWSRAEIPASAGMAENVKLLIGEKTEDKRSLHFKLVKKPRP